MAITHEISSSQTALCGSIYIEDLSTYGESSPDTRDDFGIAIFIGIDPGSGVYTDDSSLADLSNPGAVGSAGDWDIDIPNSLTQNYQITAYWAPLWIIGDAPFTAGDVVFYDGSFYLKTAIGTGTGIPGVSSEWSVLSATDYATFAAATNLLEMSTYEDVVACAKYRTIFKECDGVHRVIDNSENANRKRYSVTYYDGTEAIAATIMSGEYADITLSEDHIYIITIEEETSLDVWEEVAKLPIYEYCNLKTCVTYLLDSLLCNDWDPCCDNCDEDAVKKKMRQRLQLNQLAFIYGTLLLYINEEHTTFLGVVSMDADRLTYMERIDNLFDKMKLILQRCELCAGAWQDSSRTSTNSGSYKPCNC